MARSPCSSACWCDDIYRFIETYIESRPDEQINLVGHSLGEWNAARLAELLAQRTLDDGTCAPIQVSNLITLDPVGTRYRPSPGSFYEYEYDWPMDGIPTRRTPPAPTPTVGNWINVPAAPYRGDFSDTIANTGGRWRYPPGAHINAAMDVNHASAYLLFAAPITASGQSAQDILIDSIRNR